MRKTATAKIVLVGGGSYIWTPRLVTDLMRTPELEGSEIVLLDPNQKAAREVLGACETIRKTLDKRFDFRITADETAAFRGADFVGITISTGGLEAMAIDLKVPEKYGIYHTVGDSIGPAGWSRSLRNAPVMAAMGAKIARLAPRAVLMNYTNPMALLTGVLSEVSGLRTVGLCHGVYESYAVLQKLFGVEEKDLAVDFGGVNHFFWIADFTVKGEPGYPKLRRRLGGKTLDQALGELKKPQDGLHGHHAFCSMLYEEFGYLPYVGDRHTCEFLPGNIAPKPAVLKRYKLRRTSAEERMKGREKCRARTLKLAKGELPPPERSREEAADIMAAVLKGKVFNDVVNIPNAGQVANLPRGAVVETLGRIDGLGFRAVNAGALPPTIQRLVEPHCIIQQMTQEAALEGNKEMALQALMLDPASSHLTPAQIRSMGNDLISATRKWLPQFKPDNNGR